MILDPVDLTASAIIVPIGSQVATENQLKASGVESSPVLACRSVESCLHEGPLVGSSSISRRQGGKEY